MENLSVADAAKKIRIYLRQNIFRPYFVAADCAAAVEELKKIFNDIKIQISDTAVNLNKKIYPSELAAKVEGVGERSDLFGLGRVYSFHRARKYFANVAGQNFWSQGDFHLSRHQQLVGNSRLRRFEIPHEQRLPC